MGRESVESVRYIGKEKVYGGKDLPKSQGSMSYTYTGIVSLLKETDVVNDDCGDLMLCFQSHWGLGV